MKLLAFILALSATFSCYAQTTTDATNKPGHFYWSLSKAKEIPIAQTLAKVARLSETEKKELAHIITAQIKDSGYSDNGLSAKEFNKLIWQTRIELVDLNGDGVPEILAQGFDSRINCSATGNCEFFVFQRTPQGFKLLLDTYEGDVGGVELFTVNNQSTHGFKDLVLAAHESAFEKALFVFRFNGKKYSQSACYSAHWDYPDNDGLVMHRNPVISICEE